MQRRCAAAPILLEGALSVSLSARPASCKPIDRGLEEQKASTCSGPVTSTGAELRAIVYRGR